MLIKPQDLLVYLSVASLVSPSKHGVSECSKEFR